MAMSPSTIKSSDKLLLPPAEVTALLSSPALTTGVTIGSTVPLIAARMAMAQTSMTLPSQVRTRTSTARRQTYFPGTTQSADRSTACGSCRDVKIAVISISSVLFLLPPPPDAEAPEGRRSTLSSTVPSAGRSGAGLTKSARTEQITSVSDPGRLTRDDPFERTSGTWDDTADGLDMAAALAPDGVTMYGL